MFPYPHELTNLMVRLVRVVLYCLLPSKGKKQVHSRSELTKKMSALGESGPLPQDELKSSQNCDEWSTNLLLQHESSRRSSIALGQLLEAEFEKHWSEQERQDADWIGGMPVDHSLGSTSEPISSLPESGPPRVETDFAVHVRKCDNGTKWVASSIWCLRRTLSRVCSRSRYGILTILCAISLTGCTNAIPAYVVRINGVVMSVPPPPFLKSNSEQTVGGMSTYMQSWLESTGPTSSSDRRGSP